MTPDQVPTFCGILNGIIKTYVVVVVVDYKVWYSCSPAKKMRKYTKYAIVYT